VVGDIDQSIYSWRGADFKNIMRFENDYKDATTILLEQNYRSTKTILTVANTIIAKNVMRKDKNLFTDNEEGDQISLYIAGDEKDEASFIARTAKMLVSQGVSPSEIAVLYRANFQSRVIEEACIKKELAYELIGTKFFERREVREVLSYIKGALNPESLSDLKRIINVPARGIGKVTMLKVFEGGESELTGAVRIKIEKWRELLREIKTKAETVNPSEVVKYVIKHSGLETMYMDDKIEGAERLENIRELVTIATGYDGYEIGEGIEKFLEHTALSSDQDEVDKKVGVKLMTVHASKGLEFDYIFIGGLEQGQFPSERVGKQSKEDSEEERRLFYVALTRARKKIYLAYTQMRTIYGSRQINVPSEFIADIGEEFLQYENGSPDDQVDWSKGLLQLDF
jgi:DNA helicase-2/ATP-dependent DNA helicase PcrA